MLVIIDPLQAVHGGALGLLAAGAGLRRRA